MKIDKKLNLVIPLPRDETDGPAPQVYSMPVGRGVFETYFLVMSKAFARIYKEGLDFVAGPRVASMMIRQMAQETARVIPDRPGLTNWWEGPDGVEMGLMGELRRLTSVFSPTTDGWQGFPFEDALKKGIISEEEGQEIEGAISFFTLILHMHTRAKAMIFLSPAASLWGWQIVSSTIMEFRSSLPTLTPPASTATRGKASSIAA